MPTFGKSRGRGITGKFGYHSESKSKESEQMLLQNIETGEKVEIIPTELAEDIQFGVVISDRDFEEGEVVGYDLNKWKEWVLL
jgi:hypothetical protein